jgi:hypothetical protein
VASSKTAYVGGYFTAIGASARARIAALDTSTGRVTSFIPGANVSVDTLAASGSTLYAGGGFTTMGGRARHHIAAIDMATGQ